MCGRVFQTLNPNVLLRLAGTKMIQNKDKHTTGYNMGPDSYLPTVKYSSSEKDNHRELDMMKWGHPGPFGQNLHNARIEEAAEKSSFKNLVDTSRCVIIVDGYFEWNRSKHPFVFRSQQEKKGDKSGHLYLAGFITKDDCTVICTREALSEYHKIHNRMPVILDEDELDMWLDCENNKFEDILPKILNEKKAKWTHLEYYETSPFVNDMKNDSKDNISRKDDEKEEAKPTKKDASTQATAADTQSTGSETEVIDEEEESESKGKKNNRKRRESTNSNDSAHDGLKKVKK